MLGSEFFGWFLCLDSGYDEAFRYMTGIYSLLPFIFSYLKHVESTYYVLASAALSKSSEGSRIASIIC